MRLLFLGAVAGAFMCGAPAFAASADHGKTLYTACQACHTLVRGRSWSHGIVRIPLLGGVPLPMTPLPASCPASLIPKILIGRAVVTVSTSCCKESRNPNWARQ